MPLPLRDRWRSFVWRHAAPLAERVRSFRVRRQVRRFNRESGVDRLLEHFRSSHGLTVLHGSFAGMRYIDEATGSSLLPKIVGTYERELRPVLEAAIGRSYGRVVDVGCAEGYYAVGLAMRIPATTVFAFDSDPLARRLCRRLAARNDVAARVRVGAFCRPRDLEKLLDVKALVVCDCEGYELVLLDPSQARSLLRRADLLVETHDHLRAGTTDEIVRRFKDSHEVTIIPAVPRGEADFVPELSGLQRADRGLCVNEFRPPGQRWLWLVSRERGLST